MSIMAINKALGIECEGDPVTALRDYIDELRAHNGFLRKRLDRRSAILDDFGEKCAFGDRCVRCKAKPDNCVTRLRDLLDGTDDDSGV